LACWQLEIQYDNLNQLAMPKNPAEYLD